MTKINLSIEMDGGKKFKFFLPNKVIFNVYRFRLTFTFFLTFSSVFSIKDNFGLFVNLIIDIMPVADVDVLLKTSVFARDYF